MFDWSKYAVGGAQRPDSFTGLNPDFATALSQMLLAAETDLGPNALSITSAYRSPEKQAELYEAALEKYGSPAVARKWVAPPGGSMHNKGLAVDFGAADGGLLRDPNSREAQWLKANAANFGLDVPMSWEPWQVELAGARGGEKIADEAMSLLGKGPQTPTKGPQMMQEQKPQGLLGSLGIQKMEEGAEGEAGQRFYQRDSFKDTAAVLAQGFGRMGIMGMEEIADQVAKQRTEVKAKNKTMEALSKMGTPQAQAAVEYINAGGDPVSALKMAFERPKSDRTALMKNYEFFISQGMSPEDAMSAVRSGPTINMPGETMKIMSDGRIAVADPAVEGGVRFVTPPGSAAAAKAQQEAEAEAQRRAKLQAQTGQKETVVAGSIDALIGQIDKGGIFDLPEAGVAGNLLGRLGVNQEAVDFRNELATVQANIAFDRLQQMREASKTGGALGAVSERELDLLMNAYGNINQSTSPERLKENLQTIKNIMTKIENDPTASQFYYGGGTPAPASSQPNGVSVGEPY